MNNVINYLTEKFNFPYLSIPDDLSLALGTAELSPLRLARAYAVFANFGQKVDPFIIDHIENGFGKILYQTKTTPNLQISARNAYLITNVLKDVVKSTAGTFNYPLKRTDLAGKTGTTNNQVDAWFAGFNHDLTTVVWMGFSQPESLDEYAAQSVFPIWLNFMQKALENVPEIETPIPDGIVTEKIDEKTGLRVNPDDFHKRKSYFELFYQENIPDILPITYSNSDDNHHHSSSSQTEDEDAGYELF